MARGDWPVDVRPVGVATCGALLWRMRGELHVTVVVKATFGLAPATEATLLPPDDILRKDRHYDRSPARSVETANDLAPYRPRTDVTVIGHAHSPPGRRLPSSAVRLAVFRDRPLLDKTLYVFGDRSDAAAAPQPFDRLPLRWERAFGGVHTPANPVGVGDAEGDAPPNIIDPRDPRAPAGFGPLSRYWQVRKQLGDRPQVVGDILEIPEAMRWAYFQAAPPDQQVEYLRGDEWIVLDGMHPSLPRLYSRLPSARAAAWVLGADADRSSTAHPLPLVADGLAIDADRQRCSLTWRGGFVIVRGEAGVGRLHIHAGVELPGRPAQWPREVTSPAPPPQAPPPPPPPPSAPKSAPSSPGTAPAPAPAPAPLDLDLDLEPTLPLGPGMRRPNPLESTATLPGGERRSLGAPFPLAEPRTATSRVSALRPPDLPGTPWGEPARPAPEPLGNDYDTMMFVRVPPPPPPTLGAVRLATQRLDAITPQQVAGDPPEPDASTPPPLEPGDDETTTLKGDRPSQQDVDRARREQPVDDKKSRE